MEIIDEKKIWNECRERICEIIRVITKETSEEQASKLFRDAHYHSAIDLLTQMLFTLETDDRFIQERKKAEAEVMYQNTKSHLKIYGIDV